MAAQKRSCLNNKKTRVLHSVKQEPLFLSKNQVCYLLLFCLCDGWGQCVLEGHWFPTVT